MVSKLFFNAAIVYLVDVVSGNFLQELQIPCLFRSCSFIFCLDITSVRDCLRVLSVFKNGHLGIGYTYTVFNNRFLFSNMDLSVK